MIKQESFCVGCPPEMGCIGTSCPYWLVDVYYCDTCGCEGAEYRYEDEEICEDCLRKEVARLWAMYDKDEKANLVSERELDESELDDIFDCFTLSEQIETLDMYVTKVGD